MVLPVNEGGFDDADKPTDTSTSISQPEPTVPVLNVQPIEIVNIVNPDKPYGVLKNGTKPTFKEWNLNNKDCEPLKSEPELKVCEQLIEPVVIEQPQEQEPVSITKKIKVGKNKRTKSVDVLIENIHTRKLNKEKYQLLKKTNISTIKNYLKN